jgi:serine acetyltransferase
VHIGDGAKVGANAVVIEDVPPHCTVVGIPAKVVRRRQPAPVEAPVSTNGVHAAAESGR